MNEQDFRAVHISLSLTPVWLPWMPLTALTWVALKLGSSVLFKMQSQWSVDLQGF